MLTGPEFPGSRKFFPFPGKNFPNGNFREIDVYCVHGTVTWSTVWWLNQRPRPRCLAGRTAALSHSPRI